jgi:hypothetical protein
MRPPRQRPLARINTNPSTMKASAVFGAIGM